MNKTLHDALYAFGKAFVSVAIVVLIGISSSPNFNGAVGLGLAGLCAAIAAGLAAVQTFIPAISFRAYVADPFGPALDSFVHAALGAFLVAIVGWLNMPDLSTLHSVVIGAIAGAINAGLRAIQGALTPGENPNPDTPPQTVNDKGVAGAPPRALLSA